MQPELAVVSLPVAALVPYAENARTHSPAQVAQIASSIAEFGFVNPVLVDGAGVLVAGHGRVMAANRLSMASVPAIRLAHLTEPQARALRLADNRIAENATWDQALLRDALAAVQAAQDIDLAALGFSADELADILAAAGDAVSDSDAPEAASLRINFSRVRSETALRSRSFSFPRSFRRSTWSPFRPPNFLRQR
jgi:ParB-like chromosome segregation protein Spo0J